MYKPTSKAMLQNIFLSKFGLSNNIYSRIPTEKEEELLYISLILNIPKRKAT